MMVADGIGESGIGEEIVDRRGDLEGALVAVAHDACDPFRVGGATPNDPGDLLAKAADDETKAYTLEQLKARGEKVYAANCVACHQASGKGTPPAFPPLDGSKVVLGPRAAQIDIVLNGKPQTAMQSFARLNNVELAAVITFTRNNWGNRTGEAVQPADIKARRK